MKDFCDTCMCSLDYEPLMTWQHSYGSNVQLEFSFKGSLPSNSCTDCTNKHVARMRNYFATCLRSAIQQTIA